jgi:hypothetical protein
MIIYGTFTGKDMVGDDKITYAVPPNYASKSLLVEGDGLKLIITDDGAYIYKQIKQVPRDRIIGTVLPDLRVYADYQEFNVLPSSISYFRLEPGDKVSVILPFHHKCKWAVIEHVIH